MSRDRVTEIRARLETASDLIRKDSTLVDNKLTIRLNFEDEEQLAEMWLQAVGDIKYLLEEFAHE